MSLRSLAMTVCGVVRSAVVFGVYSDGSKRRSQCPAWYCVRRCRTTCVGFGGVSPAVSSGGAYSSRWSR
eukprot:9633584-Prorocentrum_lima.AAC.1